ncbi:MAG: Hsp20/alpha crystallin family protein [Pseudomonadota bacterium]
MYYATWKPAADIFYSGNQWLIRMELAGVAADEVNLLALRNVLTVRGRRRDMRIQTGFVCHALEISYSHFERVITLPADISVPSIRLEFTNGILTIFLTTESYQ